MSRLSDIQFLVRIGRFYLTEHAYEEAATDGFDIYDVEHGILTGRIRRTWPQEETIEVVGRAMDGRLVGVVCRFTLSGKVRIITVYEGQS